MAQDLDVVRHELASRIAALDVRAPYARAAELAAAVDEIRVIAHAAGLSPAVTVLHFIAAALGRGERGPSVLGVLSLMREATECGRSDAQAISAWGAASARM